MILDIILWFKLNQNKTKHDVIEGRFYLLGWACCGLFFDFTVRIDSIEYLSKAFFVGSKKNPSLKRLIFREFFLRKKMKFNKNFLSVIKILTNHLAFIKKWEKNRSAF